MPKAKQKVPKTEKMWMGWNGKWYITHLPSFLKSGCQTKLTESGYSCDEAYPVPVRIVPEAEYQRLRKAKKGGP